MELRLSTMLREVEESPIGAVVAAGEAVQMRYRWVVDVVVAAAAVDDECYLM